MADCEAGKGQLKWACKYASLGDDNVLDSEAHRLHRLIPCANDSLLGILQVRPDLPLSQLAWKPFLECIMSKGIFRPTPVQEMPWAAHECLLQLMEAGFSRADCLANAPQSGAFVVDCLYTELLVRSRYHTANSSYMTVSNDCYRELHRISRAANPVRPENAYVRYDCDVAGLGAKKLEHLRVLCLPAGLPGPAGHPGQLPR